MKIRRALREDSKTISKLAYKSKAYWGYTEEFLEQCREDLTVKEEYIEENPVYVMEDNAKIIAFYSFSLDEKKLESLFIDPEYIGRGLGRMLWSDLMRRAKQLHFKEFTIDSDPYAEAFYIKMGAQKIGVIPSTVFPERFLPLMSVKVLS